VATMKRNWIILGVAAAVLLTYAVAPGSISATYDKQQAASQANVCGEGSAYFSYATYATYAAQDVFCSDTGSQVQGEENAAALTSEQS